MPGTVLAWDASVKTGLLPSGSLTLLNDGALTDFCVASSGLCVDGWAPPGQENIPSSPLSGGALFLTWVSPFSQCGLSIAWRLLTLATRAPRAQIEPSVLCPSSKYHCYCPFSDHNCFLNPIDGRPLYILWEQCMFYFWEDNLPVSLNLSIDQFTGCTASIIKLLWSLILCLQLSVLSGKSL